MKSIRRAWHQSGMTQAEFAGSLGISVSTLKRSFKAPHVPLARRLAAQDVAFRATHSDRQVARRAQRQVERLNRMERVKMARADESPLTLHRGVSAKERTESVTLTGRQAGRVRAAYERANQNRERMGLPRLSPEGYYGNPSKLTKVLSHGQSLKALGQSKNQHRQAFLSSVMVAMQRAGLNDAELDAVEMRLRELRGPEIDEMFRVADKENWDVITSPIDEDTGLPATPDVSGVFEFLGMQRPVIHIAIG